MEVVCSVSAVNSMNTPVFLFFFNSNSQCMTMIRPARLVWWKWKRLHSSRGHPHTWHLTIKCWAPWPGLSGVRVQLIFSPTSRIIEFPDTWKLRKIEKKNTAELQFLRIKTEIRWSIKIGSWKPFYTVPVSLWGIPMDLRISCWSGWSGIPQVFFLPKSATLVCTGDNKY